MSIVARTKFNSKLKISTTEIGYYSYTNRCVPCGKSQPHILHIWFFPTHKATPKKPKE